MRMSHSDDELPELSEIFALPKSTKLSTATSVRRSPRKRATSRDSPQRSDSSHQENLTRLAKDSRQDRIKTSPKKSGTSTIVNQEPGRRIVNSPSLENPRPTLPVGVSSNNRSSSQYQKQPVRLPHVDSLLLPLSRVAVQPQISHDEKELPNKWPSKKTMSSAAKFVLNEARCNDDEGFSGDEQEDEEDTDLSGFIVDDDADLSYQEWSDGDSIPARKREHNIKPRRRLQQGSPHRRREEGSRENANNLQDDSLISELRNLDLGQINSDRRVDQIEIIDLTNSPEHKIREEDSERKTNLISKEAKDALTNINLLDRFTETLRLQPPQADLQRMSPGDPYATDSHVGSDNNRMPAKSRTPPATPPPSPSKLKSPAKLISPSKRDTIPRSPHRQSTDAFWDLHTINSWNDQYSPKKVELTSPRKRHLAHFQIWSDDSADEDGDDSNSSSRILSPCASPTNPRSPSKLTDKAERQRVLDEKRAAKARKAAFDKVKESMALELLTELDRHITSNKISTLSASTGGVKVTWSNTLRSTAGRANWRRTVTKPSGYPVKASITPEGPGVKVEHFANIELAAKVIDCEDRLVNTLAHEFCHLANFMVSNIRGQPHGASFKAWASKVTKHLHGSDNDLWRKVEVTTKHSYKIDHKYLWACVGRERSKVAGFLNIADDEGCGAEYGRHSKSIDTDTQRCGRCKGKLVQVRPKPREARPAKKTQSKIEVSKGRTKIEIEEKVVEVIDLSD